MRDRLLLGALLAACVIAPLTGCSNPSGLDSIALSPSSTTLSAAGQSVQFTVTGTYGHTGHTQSKIVSSGVSFSSSNTAVVTVDSDGLATAISAGTATITATAQAFNGPTSASASITVTPSGGTGPTGGSVVSLSVIPGSQSVAAPGDTTQFLAIGTTSSGATEDITNDVAWSSSSTQIATVGAFNGLATAVGAGTSTITARYNAGGGSTVVGTATFTVSGGTTQQFTALTLIPNAESLSASGQTSQLVALATSGATGLQQDVTGSSQVTWQSSEPSVATVSSTGLITGEGVGSTTITALLSNQDGSIVSGSTTVTVSLTAPPEPLLSLEIIPSSITVNDFNLSGQFIAIATYSSAPYVRDVTNDPNTTWLSSAPNIFPINNNTGGGTGASAGIVTSEGSGSSTIIAEAKNPGDGTIQTATATFNCPQVLAAPGSNTPPSCPDTERTGSPLLLTLTIYQRGLNTTNWLVTAPSATGTPNVIHCGPGWTGDGGSVCTATYPATTNGLPTTVTLTSPAGAGAFGGWSYNCVPTAPITADGPNSCTVILENVNGAGDLVPTDSVVGVIVN